MQNIAKKGFTLMEVLTAVLIMSMMMIAVISFIDYTSTIWRTGQETVTNKNYSRLAFDFIQKELLNANIIRYPTNYNNNDNQMTYISSNGNEKYRSFYLRRTDLFLLTSSNDYGTSIESPTEKKFILLAKNVNKFNIIRRSLSTFEITIVIQSSEENEESDDGSHNIVSSDTMILYAPMVRQE